MSQPLIFISHSSEDELEIKQLLTHLGVLEREGFVALWSQDRIEFGTERQIAINQAMGQAKIAILVITANYLNSERLSTELSALRQRQEEELIIIPLIARACPWRTTQGLAGLSVRPRHEQPVWREGGHHVNDELAALVEEISALVGRELPTAKTLAEAEQRYRERLRARYAEDAPYYIPLKGETTEVISRQPERQAPRSARRRRQRAMAEYHEWIPTGQEIKRVKLDTLRQGVDKYPCIILLGDPGSGKTTALEHLAYELVGEAGKLPLPLRLSKFEPGMSVEGFIRQGWAGSEQGGDWGMPQLAANLEGYLTEGKLFLLFDALNEMPHDGYRERARALRGFIDTWSATGNRFLVTCRVLDYGEELSGLQRIEIQPLSEVQIQAFIKTELPQTWETLWQRLASEEADQRRLLEMARNPYLLTMMIDIFVEDGQLGRNRAELMEQFSQILIGWAKHKPHLAAMWLDEAVQREALSQTAFEMQARAGSGAAVETRHVKKFIPGEVQTDPAYPPDPIPSPDRVLTLAAGANIIEMPGDRSTVRFYHQLLQEYFAGRSLLKQKLADLAHLWRWPWLEQEMPLWERPERNYDPLPPPPPTGWEETTILAAGLAPETDDQLVRVLVKVNPVLAGRCLHEGQAKIDGATRQSVIEALLAAIDDPAVALRVRIAAGEVLGHLGDPRLGEWVTIPAGKFVMGGEGQYDGKPQHELHLPEYEIARYPLTNTEFMAFVEAGGYQERRWWTEAGWQAKEEGTWTEPDYWQDSRFNKPNQPVVGVSWFEAVAFCRWRSAETGQTVRLPTEAEWEKAARGTAGRTFPWGNEFEANRVNMDLGDQVVNATTPVGIYPGGRSPYGLADCAGNVCEWCATQAPNYELKPYPYQIEDEWSAEYLNGTNVRVLRGGSWVGNDEGDARCANRSWSSIYDRDASRGFRCLRSPI